MDKVKAVLMMLWTEHRRKALAFLLGLLFAVLAAISGVPLSEIKDAAKDASSVEAPVVQPQLPVVK